jgi:phage virion morphogenesis protein
VSGARISLEFDDRQIQAAMKGLTALVHNWTPLLRTIGTGLARNVQDRMDKGVDPQGHPWTPLKPAYAAFKKGPGILRESGIRGGLQGSITFTAARNQVVVGTAKVYGAVHQFGATIKPRKGKYLIFRMGPKLVFAKHVTIPARPYLGFGTEDRETVMDVLDFAMQRALRGA